MSLADIEALRRRGVIRRFQSGQALAHHGQVPDRVFLLLSGHVKVYVTTPTGKEIVLALRRPGDLIGELSALDGKPRSASLEALEAVEAVVVTSADFSAFLIEHPAAALDLLRTLSGRLRDSDAKRIEYMELDTMGRVARRILELAEDFGEAKGDVIEYSLLKQDDHATYAMSSEESFGRAVRQMRDLGWIETGRKKIRVLNPDAIRRFAA
jgi:CRP/FNR family transcriptional regulator, cyclic AMP receptor protein